MNQRAHDLLVECLQKDEMYSKKDEILYAKVESWLDGKRDLAWFEQIYFPKKLHAIALFRALAKVDHDTHFEWNADEENGWPIGWMIICTDCEEKLEQRFDARLEDLWYSDTWQLVYTREDIDRLRRPKKAVWKQTGMF